MAKRGTHDHPKTKGLARILQIPRAQAYGMLCLLWEFAADRCPQGDVGKYTDEEIAEELLWPEDRDCKTLIDALVEKKWLDRDVVVSDGCSGRLVIHDWVDHCEDSVHMALARAGRYFATGVMPKLSRLSDKEKGKVLALYKSGDVEPNVRTNPELVRTNQKSVRTTKPSLALPSPALPCQTNSPLKARSKRKSVDNPPGQIAAASTVGEPDGLQANFSPDRMGFRQVHDPTRGGMSRTEVQIVFSKEFKSRNGRWPTSAEIEAGCGGSK